MTPTDKPTPMTVDALMKLATDYAHCYAFVGDDTMPRRQAELRAAIEQYGREQGFEPTAQRDVREACYELRDALGNPVISGTGNQTLQGQTIRMAAARLRGSGEPVPDQDHRAIVEFFTLNPSAAKLAWDRYTAPQSHEPLTDEQIDRHTLLAQECPPGSKVILVSSLRRLRAHNIRSEG